MLRRLPKVQIEAVFTVTDFADDKLLVGVKLLCPRHRERLYSLNINVWRQHRCCA